MKKTPEFRENSLSRAARTAIISLFAGSVCLGNASGGIPVSQVPPLQKSKSEPAPNIILTLDDSGSMSTSDVTMEGIQVSRMQALQDSVRDTFGAYENGEFRLAYQALSDTWDFPAWFGSSRPARLAFSRPATLMKYFRGAHRDDFLAWSNSLIPLVSTPLQSAVASAGLYTMGYSSIRFRANPSNPYYIVDSRQNTLNQTYTYNGETYSYDPLDGLDCRRTVHILMTDGLWNDGLSSSWEPSLLVQDSAATRVELPVVQPNISGRPDARSATKVPYSAALARENAGELYPSNINYQNTNGVINHSTYAHYIRPGASTGVASSYDFPGSLASTVFNYWASDLRPDLADNIKPVIKQAGSETFTRNSSSKIVPEWWNPKNNPATWQNLQTYTIGFGRDFNNANISQPMFEGSYFQDLLHENTSWLLTLPGFNSLAPYNEKAFDLKHAAYNGRGKFYSAQSGDALRDVFADILSNIISDSSSNANVKATGSASNLRGNTMIYVASYDAENNKWTGQIDFWASAEWGENGATQKVSSSIPAANNRTILTFIDNEGEAFTWDEIDDLDDKSSPKKTEVNLSQAQVEDMRAKPLGDIINSNIVLVGKPTGGLYKGIDYRHFANKISARTHMVYAGANDGMLHGFDAGQATPSTPGTGVERLAYIPRGILPKLQRYLHKDYEHEYFVDGALFSADVQIEKMNKENGAGKLNGWRTVLVGSLGAGGKGYYVLDVTDPNNFKEDEADDIVLVDKTDGSDRDIGLQIGAASTTSTDVTKSAQIVQINLPSKENPGRKQWAVIMGNGINSENGRPVLLVQSLEDKKTLYKIDACANGNTARCDAKPLASSANDSNGLFAPTPVDLNGDGAADIVYAGDLQGNMWKFDISSSKSTEWRVGLDGHPLFTAKGLPENTKNNLSTAFRQPITAAPLVLPHPNGGLMVAFGTGRNISTTDRSDHDTNNIATYGNRLNSFYGIRDLQKFTFSGATITFDASSATGVSSALQTPNNSSRFAALEWKNNPAMTEDATHRIFRGASSTDAIASNSLGWYVDFPEVINQNAAKVLETPVLGRNNVIQFLSTNVASEQITSVSPNQEVCGISQNYSGAQSVFNLFNVFTGENPNLSIYIDGTDINAGLALKSNRIKLGSGGVSVHSGPGSFKSADGSAEANFPRNPGKFVGWRIIK